MVRLIALLLMMLVGLPMSEAWAKAPVELKGSKASMRYQNKIAKVNGLAFAGTEDEVRELVARGELVPVPGDGNYRLLHGVSFPYARPELKLFIERLGAQYHEATGEKLVVTSLTRATEAQPWNAHQLSVHPTGMAVDFRISSLSTSRAWLESVLLKLEGQGLLDVTRERNPPHYHVALFPDKYLAHVQELESRKVMATALLPERSAPKQADKPAPEAAKEAPQRSPWPVLAGLILLAGGLAVFSKARPAERPRR